MTQTFVQLLILRERFPSGELRLLGIEPVEKQEFVRILRNEEERAREK